MSFSLFLSLSLSIYIYIYTHVIQLPRLHAAGPRGDVLDLAAGLLVAQLLS